MSINSLSSVSFKAYIPVRYYAKHPTKDGYVPVVKNENLRKCHGFLVRNLNGTAKSKTDLDFVNIYRRYDSDYNNVRAVHSVYNMDIPIVYMVTGKDVDIVNQMAKPVGMAKGRSMDVFGHSKSLEAGIASKVFQLNIRQFIEHNCKPVKTKDTNQPLELKMYFNPVYKKKSGDLKGFEFVGAQFVEADTKQQREEYSVLK